jgi:hypothetical protein
MQLFTSLLRRAGGLLLLAALLGGPASEAKRPRATGPEINVVLGPTAYASGSTYDFGTVPVGTLSALQTFTIQNLSSTDNLTLTGFIATGPLSTGTPTAPFLVGPGGSTTFGVNMRAMAAGLQTGRFIIANDDSDESSYVLNFTITGGATAVTWTGAVDTRWELAGNWSPAQVPTAGTAVTVPVVPNQPLVTTPAACANLSSAAGTRLAIAAPGYLAVADYVRAFGAVAMSVHFDGGLNATGGLVLLSGPGTQEAGTNGGNCTFWDLTVAARTSNAVRPYGGTLNVRHVLTLAGNIDAGSGAVNLLSDANGTAMIVNQGGRVNGLGTMQRYIAPGLNAGPGYRHVSSPTSFNAVAAYFGQGFAPVLNPAYNTAGNTVTPFPTFYGYDEARQGAAGVPGPLGFDQGWFSPASTSTALGAGRGSTVQATGGSTLNCSGGFTTGPVAVGALSRNGSGPFAGYHLLGNPYPSPISWPNVAKPAGLDDAVYVFRSTSQYGGTYDAYVNGQGTLANGEIAAMQGFFVHVSQTVPAFTFTDAARLTTYTNPVYQRGAADTRPTLDLALRPAGTPALADHAFVYFEAGATAALDAHYDAAKLPNSNGLSLASRLGADDYAVNGLPPLGPQPLALPLAVQVPAAGAYELAAEQLRNFAPGTAVYLRDTQQGTLTPLSPATRYPFTMAGTSAPGRFLLEFRLAGALASAAQVLAAPLLLYPNPAHGGAATLTGAQPGQVVTVYDALGRPVTSVAADAVGTAALVLPSGLARGVYVVRSGARTLRLVVE